MSEALLATDIVEWLRSNAVGHERAKPRRMLMEGLIKLSLLSPFALTDKKVFDREDRKMRRACEEMPDKCGSCSKGYFLIVNDADRKIAKGQLIAPAKAMFEREKRIEAPSGQGRLF